MDILVIGGSGFIGSYLIKKLVHENHKVTNFDLDEINIETVNSIKGDIRVEADLFDRLKASFDCVYILAAIHRDDIEESSKYYETNSDALINVINFCVDRKIAHIIYYSSAAVYGDLFADSKESGSLNAESHYGKSKVIAESHLMKWSEQDPDRKLLIIRPSVVYGKGSKSNMNRMIDYIKSNKFFIIGKGSNIKSISYVENLVGFTYYASNIDFESKVNVFNYCDFPQYSLQAVCSEISRITNSKKVRKIPYFFGYIFGILADIVSFLINKKLPISLNRIKKSRTYTSLNTRKIEDLNYSKSFDFKDSIVRTTES